MRVSNKIIIIIIIQEYGYSFINGTIISENSSLYLNDINHNQNARQTLDNHARLLDLIDNLRQLESGLASKLPQRNEKGWKNFFVWTNEKLSNQLGYNVKLDDSLSVEYSTGQIKAITKSEQQECSLITKKAIKKGDIIFDIHRNLMLTNETALKDKDLGEFIRNDSIASTMQNVALVLHLLNELSKGDSSYWSPYLNILPDKLLPILEMKKDQFKNFLGSAHLFEALKMIRAIARQYSYFYKRFEVNNHLPIAKDFTFKYYCWGVSIVCSRQNNIPSDRQLLASPVINALIPILDMCNHSYDSNQAIFEDNHIILYSPKNLNSNEEIFINYGTRTSGDFFIHNGFVPETIKFDAVPFSIELNKQDPEYASISKLLKILNMPTSGSFKLVENNYESRHRRDPHLIMFLIVYLLNKDELDMILKSDDPVGLADHIYEFVQYKQYPVDSKGTQTTENGVGSSLAKAEITIIAERLTKVINDYMNRRASIGIALIDRALDQQDLGVNLRRLLTHERRIYESFLLKEA